jgi:hypothetical protein
VRAAVKNFDRSRAILRLSCLSLSVLLAPAIRAEQWPVKQFEIFMGIPYAPNNPGLVSVAGAIDNWWEVDEAVEPDNVMSDAVKAEVEGFLHEMAVELERLGFKPPVIEPILTNRHGEQVYRVYYYDYGSGAASPARRRSDVCGQLRPTVELNAAKFLENGGIPPKSYQDLAHELFHGVQASYPLFREHCQNGPGGWISEGIAQAVGADLAAWSSRNVNHPNRGGQWVAHRWGLRDYSTPLPQMKSDSVSEKTLAYGASSFWRYLGEYAASGGAAGTRAIRPDYRYLIDFFNSGMPGEATAVNGIGWLNEQMIASTRIGLSLDRIFPNFTTTFAAYINQRTSPPGRTPEENLDRYLKAMFQSDQCPVIRLNDNHPDSRLPIEIRAFAAGCVRLSLAYSFPTDVLFSVTGGDKARLEALTLGAENGATVVQPIMVNTGSEWTATWILNVPVGMETPVFVITNMADVPEKTVDFSGTLEVAPTAQQNNLAFYGPLPPSAPAEGTRPAARTDSPSGQAEQGGSLITMETQAQRVGEQIDTGLNSLNPNLAHANTMVRRPAETPCADAFQFTICGPHTSVNLEMAPGMYGSGVQSTGRGGVFGQFASMLSGVAAAGPEQSMEEMQRLADLADSFDGSHVSITFPLIDYGFTGTFNNAYLSVSRRGDGVYQALGPQDAQPGPGVQFPLSGRVTIESYTPMILRGSYSANLVDMERVNLTGDDPTLPIHETIEGRFQIIGAWRGDERIGVTAAEEPVDSVLKDVQEMMPGIDPQYLKDILAAQDTDLPDIGGPGGSAGGYIGPACDCSCNRAPDAEPPCDEVCAGTFAACEGLVATQVAGPAWMADARVEDSGAEPFLRTIPDACELIDENVAMRLLGEAGVRPAGAREYYPAITSQCAWRGVENGKAQIELRMLFAGLLLYNSRKDSPEELRIKAGGFGAWDDPPTGIDGVGNRSFGMNRGDTTSLLVLTGIYGTAMDSDELTTELVMTYSLTDPGREPPQRMVDLIKLARPQVENLQRLSETTHEGATGQRNP